MDDTESKSVVAGEKSAELLDGDDEEKALPPAGSHNEDRAAVIPVENDNSGKMKSERDADQEMVRRAGNMMKCKDYVDTENAVFDEFSGLLCRWSAPSSYRRLCLVTCT